MIGVWHSKFGTLEMPEAGFRNCVVRVQGEWIYPPEDVIQRALRLQAMFDRNACDYLCEWAAFKVQQWQRGSWA